MQYYFIFVTICASYGTTYATTAYTGLTVNGTADQLTADGNLWTP